MSIKTSVLVFGDQTQDPCPLVRDLVRRSRHSPAAQTFLQSASDALRHDISRLSQIERDAFQSCYSMVDLADKYAESGVLDTAVATVLHCVCQLGNLAIHLETNPNASDSESAKLILGSCTGLIVAATAATIHSVRELLHAGPDILKFSLRLGLKARRRSMDIESSSESWATAVFGVSEREVRDELQRWHSSCAIPKCNIAYISAISDDSCTISGPPSSVARLIAHSSKLSLARKAKLPISAAFHASHLAHVDIRSLIGGTSTLAHFRMRQSLLYSPSTGKPWLGLNLQELLEEIAIEILARSLHWSKTARAIIRDVDTEHVQLVSIGSSNTAKAIQLALEKEGKVVQMTENSYHSNLNEPRRWSSTDIAITGMSGRFPGAENLDDFWELLVAGRDMHREVPADRFDLGSHYDSSGKTRNTSLTPFGCFIERPGFFDTKLFNMSPREARQTDPGQRLILLTAYEALEMAGYSPNGSPSFNKHRIGTFFGQTTDDWREHNASQNIDIYYVTGGIRAFGPGRLNYHFKWDGPSYSFDTACSSSSVAIQMARSALLSRECDTAVAGGANILTGSDMFAGLSRGGFLSPTGSCKTFDDGADGYCRADGAGSIIMKRLDDAIADGDNIQAILRSVATNHSAQAVSITHPHAPTQESLFHQVLRDADVGPEEIGYVEMHGTGTQAGDSTELASVTNVLAKGRSPASPLHVGAVKANVGHGEGAAGITSVIKAILMMRHKVIPPHVGIKNHVNESLQNYVSNDIHIPRAQIPFEGQGASTGACKVMVNSFSAAGGNTSLLLQGPPLRTLEGADPRTPFTVLVSARTKKSLAGNLRRLHTYLEAHPNTRIADLAYTTSARRMHHVYRHAFVTKDFPETKDGLAKAIKNTDENAAPCTIRSDHAIFIFSGQGSQYPGMGAELFKYCQVFREKALECERLALELGFTSFIRLIEGTSSSDDTFFSPMQTQLALVSLEICMTSLWQSWGVYPTLLLGHSLGEYAALYVSGVISLSSTLYLVGKRAELMQRSCTLNSHSMLAAQESLPKLRQLIRDSEASCEISCVNGPRHIVLSGLNDQTSELERFLRARDIKTGLLKVPFAFHSSQMDPILDEFEVIAQGVKYSTPKIRFASTAKGCMIEHDKIVWPSYLRNQTRDPVLMFDAVSVCKEQKECDENSVWIECGPGPASLRMVKTILGTPTANLLTSLDQRETEWATISKSIGKAYERGLDISWPDFHNGYRDCVRVLDLPPYSFDLENEWIKYEGDWSITKEGGRPAPRILTTCVQRLMSTKSENSHSRAVFESDFTDVGLKGLISGHHVHGFDLCPASVLTEMAFAAAYHMHSQGNDPEMKNVPAMELRDVEIFKPLVLDSTSTAQKAQIICDQDEVTGIIKTNINSIDGSETTEHARSAVCFGDANAWRDEWARNRHFIEDARTRLLRSKKSHKILRSLVYRLFSSIVDYDQQYQSLEEVCMDDDLHEATAIVQLRETSLGHGHVHNPYWIDCLAQLGGFVLNGSPGASQDNVFLAHGWRALRLSGRLSSQKPYTCHVRMMPSKGKDLMVGDVYLLDQDSVVAACYDLEFRKMQKTVLYSLLSAAASRIHPPQAQNESRGEVRIYSSGNGVFTPSPSSTESSGTMISPSGEKDTDLWEKIALVIAEEIGIPRDEVSDTSTLADMGLDSLLTISILARVKQETGQTLPSSFFNSHPRMQDVRQYLEEPVRQSRENSISSKPSQNEDSNLQEDSHPRDPKYEGTRASASEDIQSISCPIVHLQGSRSPNPALFLLPDGAGSAQSYMRLSEILSTISVFGLDSAFYTRPQDFKISFEAATSAFVRAIRSVQPHGPYFLGGWSMGGMYAYEAARQLLCAGEAVQNLLMIDSPCPGTLPPLPAPTLSILEQAGVFDGLQAMGRGVPEATRTHFLHSVAALENWRPVPMSSATGRPERVDVIWAKGGVFDEATEKQREISEESWDRQTESVASKAKDWLTGHRDNYGPAGWDHMTGESNVRCHTVEGNHFSIIRAPQVDTVAAVISGILKTRR